MKNYEKENFCLQLDVVDSNEVIAPAAGKLEVAGTRAELKLVDTHVMSFRGVETSQVFEGFSVEFENANDSRLESNCEQVIVLGFLMSEAKCCH